MLKSKFRKLLLFGLLIIFVGCSDDSTDSAGDLKNPTILSVDKETSHFKSTEIGNFVATAVQRANNLDFAFLPAAYFHKMNAVFEVSSNMNQVQIDAVLKHFPRGPQNQLLFGTMRGDRLKTFILQRSRETYGKDLETAGLWYSLNFEGGFLTASNFLIDGRYPIDDDEFYRIAVSDDFFFGSAFPGYKFRNGFNFNFRREKYQGYINKSIEKYLKSIQGEGGRLPFWSAERAVVKNRVLGDQGFKKISEIQGSSHTSPLAGYKVITEGIVTAASTAEWYPKYFDAYIQTETPDGDERTSEGIHLIFRSRNVAFNLGDKIRVSGLVLEDIRDNGMGETVIWVDGDGELLSSGNPLPKAEILGSAGRRIPNSKISTYSGVLMRKDGLNLSDGIDFWESLEGMRVQMPDLKIVGFRGGGEDLVELSNRFYLNLMVVAEEAATPGLETKNNGLLIDFDNWDFNPEIITLTTNHLSRGIDVERGNDDYYAYNIGDRITSFVDKEGKEHKLEGVIIYQKNLFGGGEYSLITPEPQPSMIYRNIETKGFVPVPDRGTTDLVSGEGELTFATFNLENLAGNRQDRIDVIGDVISQNLQCPDVVNLVEIQDNNGISFRGSADASKTLIRLLGVVQSNCPNQIYSYTNIDPFLQAEGGQPGGNIRVSMMYNTKKLSYEERKDGSIGSQALVAENGKLSSNPGRIFPTDPVFRRTRRSTVVEFDVLSKPGEKVYVIGNHLNSKLGDIDFWGNQQPAIPNSDFKRARRAAKINQFIQWIEEENKNANIVVLGDFNALAEEESMKVLAGNGEQLQNMIFTLPKSHRYTTNHNGNSQPLDYVFVNNRLFNKDCTKSEILHINSDFMGRVSDHDPVMLKTCF
jgi:hypothetical protein